MIITNLNEYQIQEMRRTMTTKQIAEHYGTTVNAIYKWCGRRKLSLMRLTDWELAEEIGTKTPKEIAYEYKLTPEAIYHRLKKLGMCTNQPGQAGGRK